MAGDGLPSNMTGMSKIELYDVMSQMKVLVKQNQQQARQILIQNPSLTKTLFQAQIMLGMVQPPQVIPTIQPTGALSLSTQPAVSQLPQPIVQMHPASPKLEQPMQTSVNQHLAMQPQLPPQVRPSMQPFPHQVHPHMGPNAGYPQSGATQHHHSQPAYHPAMRPPASMGPSFLPGQPPGQSQLPPQPLYQMGGSHLRPEFNQVGNSMQADRGSPWIPSLPENTSGTQLPGPSSFPAQMGPGSQPPRAGALSPEMEQALLQQVRSLTPEQINMLPPEQRNQVLQLQQMLR
ncbi:hypothetical protein EJD97_015403 [Solanum chilense]|uniref:Cleavage stimulation factor subunit 2 hinge domain-containing protein n=1 Tax=Solanum chilense TaxID=4083 RepID=A0A6N2B9I3_SOLCI|nr:hypothetical protein EJD97_015403 [Solanum chilense]